jgi:hypothetical protein
MHMLSTTAQTAARVYLQQHARPLDRARYAYHFQQGSAAEVITALSAFQNADGGSGHGLEPDIRLTESSVMATTIACQRFREVQLPAEHPLVVAACAYLVATYQPERLNWPIIPATVDAAPHAPWWTPGSDLERSPANPRAEIAGYLHEYPSHFPDSMRTPVTEAVISHLMTHDGPMEMHDLLCTIRLWETAQLPASTRAQILGKLHTIVRATVEHDPTKWAGYGLQPLAVAPSPHSPFADGLRESLDHNLDFLITQQQPDGSWQPNWFWGDQWPEEWERARRDWSGVLTVDNLRILHAYGRLEAQKSPV